MTETALPIIRPMTLGELLDKAIRLYRQNFLKFIGIYAIPFIPLMLIQSVLAIFSTTSMLTETANNYESFPFAPSAMAAYLGSIVVLFVQFILVRGVATAALTRAVANHYAGKSIGILDSYRTLSNTWIKLILALVIVFIFVFVLFLWMIVPCIGWLSGPGLLFFISLVVTPLIAPIISLEKLGVWASIRRAWDMGRSRFWWLIGFASVLTLLGQLIVTGPTYLLRWVFEAVLSPLANSLEQQMIVTSLIQTLANMSLSLLYVPLQLTAMTVVYFDLRTRSEGLDLAMQLPSADETAGEAISLPEISTKSTTSFLVGIDIGRFALLSLIGIVLFVLVYVFMFFIIGLFMNGF